MNYKNPCEEFYFYTKENPDLGKKLSKHDVSDMLPDMFGVS